MKRDENVGGRGKAVERKVIGGSMFALKVHPGSRRGRHEKKSIMYLASTVREDNKQDRASGNKHVPAAVSVPPAMAKGMSLAVSRHGGDWCLSRWPPFTTKESTAFWVSIKFDKHSKSNEGYITPR